MYIYGMGCLVPLVGSLNQELMLWVGPHAHMVTQMEEMPPGTRITPGTGTYVTTLG